MSSNNTGKGKKSKGKKENIFSKPKKPMSAYNFFVRVQRPALTEEAKSRGEDATFEEIGHAVGERWQSIKNDEDAVAEYKEMARADSARYKAEMEKYYQDELVRLRTKARDGNDDSKNDGSGIQNMTRTLQQGAVGNPVRQEQPVLEGLSGAYGSTTGFNSYLQGGPVALGAPTSSSNAELFQELQRAAARDEQVWQLLSQQGASSTPNAATAQLIQAQLESIQQRQEMFVQELKSLQNRKNIFSILLENELSKAQQQPQQVPSNAVGTSAGVPGQPSVENQLAQLLQASQGGTAGAATSLQSIGSQAQAQGPTSVSSLGQSLALASLLGAQPQGPVHSAGSVQPSAAPAASLPWQDFISYVMNNQHTNPPM